MALVKNMPTANKDAPKTGMHEQMQYMIDNYDDQPYRHFAERFGVKYITIAKRVERLKKRGLLPSGHKRIPGTTDYTKLKGHEEV